MLAGAPEFLPLGIVGRRSDESPAQVSSNTPGVIEIDLPTGARLRVDASVNEKALARVFRAMKGLA